MSYYKSSGAGQFFKEEVDFFRVVSVYDFNPCVELISKSGVQSALRTLKHTRCTKDEFNAAESRARKMLGL